MRIESYSTFAACHKMSQCRDTNSSSSLNIQKISRIKLFIEVLEVIGSSVNVRISDLGESLAGAFAVDDKQDNYVQEEFEVFTLSIVNFEFLLF